MSEGIPVAEYLDPINEKPLAILAIFCSLLSFIGALFIIVV